MGRSVIALLFITCIAPEDPQITQCTPVLEKIIETQSVRQREFTTFRRDLALYFDNDMHRWEFRAKRDIWLTTENILASEVNSLYETADNLDCFSTVDWY
jgi:hypothetical protein